LPLGALGLLLALSACTRSRDARAAPPPDPVRAGPGQEGTPPSLPAEALEGGTAAGKTRGSGRSAPLPPPVPDKGIFPDLDAKVRVSLPSWTGSARLVVADGSKGGRFVLAAGGVAGFAPPDARADATVPDLGGNDADGDGIPDALDILLGATKTALDAAPYGSPYRKIAYPGGDVPRTEGVCTDVIIRAMRNAGLDLQKLVHEDIPRARASYPMVKTPNANIDHRRVKTIRPWFGRHWVARSTDPKRDPEDWLPGDVVFMDTLPQAGPDHIGIVSGELGKSGLPLIINAWTDGYRTTHMDLLPFVPVTHRYRVPVAAWKVDAALRGPPGLAARAGLALPAGSKQILMVASADYASKHAELQRWVQDGAGGWRSVGASIAVNLGHAGLGWGRGLHGESRGDGPTKTEGDGRSPAGIFALGTAFGRAARTPGKSKWPYRALGPRDRYVDDPSSPLYNTWQRAPETGEPAWRSAETMLREDGLYDLGLVVLHNDPKPVPGAGSAIFLHLDGKPPTATVGCTAMGRADLEGIVKWLDPGKKPVLIQVVGVAVR